MINNTETIDYDVNVMNKGAVIGVDYEWDQLESSVVRIIALTDNNLNIRVIIK